MAIYVTGVNENARFAETSMRGTHGKAQRYVRLEPTTNNKQQTQNNMMMLLRIIIIIIMLCLSCMQYHY